MNKDIGNTLRCGYLILTVAVLNKTLVDYFVLKYMVKEIVWDTIAFAIIGFFLLSLLRRLEEESFLKVWLGIFISTALIMIIVEKRWLYMGQILKCRPEKLLIVASNVLFAWLLAHEEIRECKVLRLLILSITLYSLERGSAFFDSRLYTAVCILSLIFVSRTRNQIKLVGYDVLCSVLCLIVIIDEITALVYNRRYGYFSIHLEERYSIFKNAKFFGNSVGIFGSSQRNSIDELLAYAAESLGWVGVVSILVFLCVMSLYLFYAYKSINEPEKDTFLSLLIIGPFVHWTFSIALTIFCNFFSDSIAPLLFFTDSNLNLLIFILEYGVVQWALNMKVKRSNVKNIKGKVG